MTSISETLRSAVEHHRAGRLTEAERLYRTILGSEPQHVDALHLLGVLADQTGHAEAAAALIRRAIELRPDHADAHNNLGNALRAQGDLNGAAASYRRSVELEPQHADAWNNLGATQRDAGRLHEAATSFRRALEIAGDYAEAFCNLGGVLCDLGSSDEAIACCLRAVELRPDFAEARYNLGNAFREAGRLREAVQAYRAALALRPDDVNVMNNLGNVCGDLGELSEAEALYRRAVELAPRFAEAHNNLGEALREQERLSEAIASFRRAIELRPEYAEAHNNLGAALADQGEFAAATACYERSLVLSPENPKARFNLGTMRLLQGDFAAGWSDYEARWRLPRWTSVPPRFACPLWNGESLEGRTLVIWAEQGLGDTLQFVRYVSPLREFGGKLVFACQKPLLKLLAPLSSFLTLAAHGEPLPPCDVYVPLLSLPRIMRTEITSVPAAIPYLFANESLVESWGERLAGIKELRIGVNWRGRTDRGLWQRRDLPLSGLEALARVPGVKLVRLQKGPLSEAERAQAERLGMLDLGEEIDREHGPFMDTAAIMKHLDLVISSDTSIPHLAGGLGVPVWTALPFASDWRWLTARRDSPWYPTMRLFRQTKPGDWNATFAELESALREFRTARGRVDVTNGL